MSNSGKHIERVIISGGGTGGHIYPAIAIANALKEINPSVSILFVGALGRMEMEKVPKAGYEIVGLPVAGLQRRLTWKNLLVPFKLISSLLKAKKIIKKFKPEVVIGVGGYASGPTLRQAESLGIPTLLQEQNSYAGLTNKMLAKKAAKICVAYNGMETYFPKDKILFTGNPVRKDIENVAEKREQALTHFHLDPSKKTILVIGGSLGARTINRAIGAGLDKIVDNGYQLIWQTGKFYKEECEVLATPYKGRGVYSSDFIYTMDLAYAAADVVISRAGALSVSELCLAEKASVLVPSPNVAEDHQTKNAMALVNEGAAILVKDDVAASELIKTSLKLLGNPEQCQELSANIKKLAKPNAAKDIAAEVCKLAQK